MKLLANENFPLSSVHYLKSRGFDIESIGLNFPGIQDHLILTFAEAEQRTILTFDRDYGELIFKHDFKPSQGVIYLRFDAYHPMDPGIIIEDLLTNNEFDFTNSLTVIDKNGIRQRKY